MAKGKGAKAKALDFSNVKDRAAISPSHRPEGDYPGKVISVQDIKMGPEKRDAWLYIIKVGVGTYAYRCGFNDNELWKIRNLFVAAGVPVPKKRQTIDPNKPVNHDVGVTLQDHEYEDKLSSEIAAVFPPSELDGHDGEPVGDDEEGVEEEEETPTPKAKAKKGKKTKAAPEPEPPAKNKKKGKVKAAPEPPAKKGKKGKKMESLDIDDL